MLRILRKMRTDSFCCREICQAVSATRHNHLSQPQFRVTLAVRELTATHFCRMSVAKLTTTNFRGHAPNYVSARLLVATRPENDSAMEIIPCGGIQYTPGERQDCGKFEMVRGQNCGNLFFLKEHAAMPEL